MKRVVLFKIPSTGGGPDLYRAEFEQAEFIVDYVPVLQEDFSTNDLGRLLRTRWREDEWAGVVITSKRGAEGWFKAAQTCEGDDGPLSQDWKDVQLFTVGSSSIDLLTSAQHSIPSRLQLDTSRAIQAKSATDLLPLLISHRHRGKYLIIRGDKSTNEIQLGLSTAQRNYHEVAVYATSARPTLVVDIEAIFQDIGREDLDCWLVFFSPSSADIVLPLLRTRLKQCLVAAIGMTTEKYLMRQGIEVDAVAEEPTAEGLLRAIQTYYQRKEGA